MDTMYDMIDEKRGEQLVDGLHKWYEANKRVLPWREHLTPYHVWVSEIMAQQTRIATLVPYYERFVARYPTIDALAQAPIDDVLGLWAGLGYYSRAHSLHKAATIVSTQYGGHLPNTLKQLLALPGIGAYTAGAILSICFGQRVPAVDGNVLRVFARIEYNLKDIGLAKTKTELTPVIAAMMPKENTAIFTQSVMELGALVCTPKNPLCGECPLSTMCKTFQQGAQNRVPVKAPKKRPTPVDKTVLLIVNSQGQVLMSKRTERLLQGLWVFYMVEGKMDAVEVGIHLKQMGLQCESMTHIGHAKHIFTHLVWHMVGFVCVVADVAPPDGYVFVGKEDMVHLAMPTAVAYFTKAFQMIE